MAVPLEIVPGPAVLAPTVGLLPSLGQRVAVLTSRQTGGYVLEPSGCFEVGTQSAACDAGSTKDIQDFPPSIPHIPNFAFIGGHCSILGGIARSEIGPRVRSALEAAQGKAVEAELWTGDSTQAASTGNLYLAGGSANFEDLTPDPSVKSPGGYALAALQEYLAGCREGGRGMIHATRATVDIWAREYLVRREGNLIFDLFDNWIIAGVGYDGSDPDGDVDPTGHSAYAYATGLVDVRLGEILINGAPQGESTIAEALDRSNNDATWIAERAYGVTWDGCCHAGIRVGLCETCCDPDGGS